MLNHNRDPVEFTVGWTWRSDFVPICSRSARRGKPVGRFYRRVGRGVACGSATGGRSSTGRR